MIVTGYELGLGIGHPGKTNQFNPDYLSPAFSSK
jgi:hypothetical protein